MKSPSSKASNDNYLGSFSSKRRQKTQEAHPQASSKVQTCSNFLLTFLISLQFFQVKDKSMK